MLPETKIEDIHAELARLRRNLRVTWLLILLGLALGCLGANSQDSLEVHSILIKGSDGTEAFIGEHSFWESGKTERRFGLFFLKQNANGDKDICMALVPEAPHGGQLLIGPNDTSTEKLCVGANADGPYVFLKTPKQSALLSILWGEPQLLMKAGEDKVDIRLYEEPRIILSKERDGVLWSTPESGSSSPSK
ncbi:MAG: hypothetical protein AB7S38_43555 [Vulcanimicrobiota bacterium]